MSKVTQADKDNLVSAFNDSLLALFFPNIDNAFGQELLENIAEYILRCECKLFSDCPGLWFDFATHRMAIILVNWNITVTDVGINIATATSSATVETFLRTRTIGEKTCTFEQVDSEDISPTGPVQDWELKVNVLRGTCATANCALYTGGGSNLPECYIPCKTGCK